MPDGKNIGDANVYRRAPPRDAHAIVAARRRRRRAVGFGRHSCPLVPIPDEGRGIVVIIVSAAFDYRRVVNGRGGGDAEKPLVASVKYQKLRRSSVSSFDAGELFVGGGGANHGENQLRHERNFSGLYSMSPMLPTLFGKTSASFC